MRHSTNTETRSSIITKLAITLVAMILLPIFGVGILAYFAIFGGF